MIHSKIKYHTKPSVLSDAVSLTCHIGTATSRFNGGLAVEALKKTLLDTHGLVRTHVRRNSVRSDVVLLQDLSCTRAYLWLISKLVQQNRNRYVRIFGKRV